MFYCSDSTLQFTSFPFSLYLLHIMTTLIISISSNKILVFLIIRYLENNARCCSQYRRYNTDIPSFLHNRPSSLVDHCMERLYSVADVEKQSIKVKDNKKGIFEVESQHPNSKGHWYGVSFGDDNTMPHCECDDWEKNRLPCKHFVMIFQLIDDWGFEKLPLHYRESPFLSLDHELVFLKEAVVHDHDQDDSDDVVTPGEDNNDMSNTASELPRRNKYTRGWSTKCKESVQQVTSLLHIVDDVETLQEVNALIHQCMDILGTAAKKEEGITLNKPTQNPTRMRRTTSSQPSATCFRDIPKARGKHPYSGRHGAKAETLKRTLNVHVDVTTGQPMCKRSKTACPKKCNIETIDNNGLRYEWK